jgi:uncharacterized membrane protein YbhN (UPF0104 family)
MGDEYSGGELVSRPRQWLRFRRRALGTVVVGAVSVGLLLWVAPPASVIDEIGHMNPTWLLVAVALEFGSCLSYVIVFRRFFPEPPRAVGRQVAWITMGAAAVLPGGNISGAAATTWLLRRHGIDPRRLLTRCVGLLFLLIGVGFVANGAAGVLLLVGVPGGPHDLPHTGVPILVSVTVLSLAALIVYVARRFGRRAPGPVRGVAAGFEGALKEMRTPHWRLIGAAGFLCLDMAALWAACAATGHPLGLLAVLIAYCTGYLATVIPIPAGIGVLDTGLAGALVLYGLSPAASVGAVLVYHAIAIWVPGLGGLVAWMPARRQRNRERSAVRLPELSPLRVAAASDAD